MGEKWQKFKIQSVLLLIKLLKTVGFYLGLFFQGIGKILEMVLFFIVKILVVPLFPFYLKFKKSIKASLANFHYEAGFLSFLTQRKILFFLLVLSFVFISFESRASLQEEFFAQAMTADEEKEELSIADFKIATDEEVTLRPISILEDDFIPARTEIEKYVVQKGDTISTIAKKFGVSINTILWENKLSPYSVIRPGQTLKILPLSGLTHKVKTGDTIEKIAKLYRSNKDDILSFNNLEEKKLAVGQIIIIPEGRMPPPPPTPPILRQPTTKEKTWLAQYGGRTRTGTNCHDFYPGQCTWYVAQKYCLTFSGHAKSWLANAARAGYPIGKTPRVGAIISLRETWYGHVAIVEEVKENTLVISEMNHLGPWKVNKREINKNSPLINGYIYPTLKN